MSLRRWSILIACVLCTLTGIAMVGFTGQGQDPCPTPTPTATATETPTPTPTPDPTPAPLYDAASPWNTPIPDDQAPDSSSDTWVGSLQSSPGGNLTSDPTQYAGPLYHVTSSMPQVTVNVTGSWSAYDNGDESRVGSADPRKGKINLPSGATPSPGSDGHIIFLYDDGTEVAFWQFKRNTDGSYQATNGYRYHTTEGYMGRMAGNGTDQAAGGGRGAGTPYLAGLVRKEEIDRGVVDHALAFAYNSPRPSSTSPPFIYPATKTDGRGDSADPPEGARMQLDPAYDVSRLADPRARIMARALQRYGAYVIDNSGSNKLYVEGSQTSGWGSDMRSIMSSIPWSAFRFVPPPPH